MNQISPRRLWRIDPSPVRYDQGTTTADTYGWDTVFAIRYSDVNSAIARAGSSPDRIDQTESSGSQTVTIGGPFGDWALTGGGSGQNVHMDLPVTALTLDDSNNQPPRIFPNVTIEIELKLEFVPQPDSANEGNSGVWHDLRLALPAAGRNIAVAVLDIRYDGQDMDNIQRALIMGLAQTWLNDGENLKKFAHTFASVNLNAKADVGEFQWMRPTHVSYAVADQDSVSSGIFAVLCMTDDRSADKLFHQVSPNAIPEGKRSAFLISKERFLARMLMPGIATMFTKPADTPDHAWPLSHFELADGETAITNKKPIFIEHFDVSKDGDGSDTYRADLKTGHFNARLQNNYIEIEFLDLFHKYNHFMNWLDVHHTVRSRSIARLTDAGKFDLVPGPEGFVGEHDIVVKKQSTAAWIELGVLSASLFALTFGMARAAYLTTTGGELAAAGAAGEAAGEGALALQRPLTQAEALALESDEAANALATLGRWQRIKNFVGQMRTIYRASIFSKISLIGGSLVSLETMLEIIAQKDSDNKLPKFEEFAAEIMKPLQWPDAADYTVESIAFNGSFHVVGDAGFAEGS